MADTSGDARANAASELPRSRGLRCGATRARDASRGRRPDRPSSPSCGWRERGPRGGWITEEPRPEDDQDNHGGKEKKQYHTRTK
ncbi:hypothetical protein NDU88_008159 [Pleurodeles waltl]|uniref:Uncharacterized protein n=1 Tax=Pleurodeles waltl TaxID=8319 RepID=A0AAV7PPK5_PLEWA|nr:hypothetical protein NDU88_008159 [Pleurodeles waltl]